MQKPETMSVCRRAGVRKAHRMVCERTDMPLRSCLKPEEGRALQRGKRYIPEVMAGSLQAWKVDHIMAMYKKPVRLAGDVRHAYRDRSREKDKDVLRQVRGNVCRKLVKTYK